MSAVSETFQAPTGAGLWLGEDNSPKDEATAPFKIAEAPHTAKRAIIVEDELFVALHLETILQDLGFEVQDIAATGLQGVQAAAEYKPEIIFMDINLRGDMDGIAAAGLIRQQFDIPIIFVTAYGDEATLSRIHTVVPGAPVLQKPPMLASLVSAINNAMGPR